MTSSNIYILPAYTPVAGGLNIGPYTVGKPRVSPLRFLNMMKVRNQPKLRRVGPYNYCCNRFDVDQYW